MSGHDGGERRRGRQGNRRLQLQQQRRADEREFRRSGESNLALLNELLRVRELLVRAQQETYELRGILLGRFSPDGDELRR